MMKISRSVLRDENAVMDFADVKTMKVDLGEETMSLTYVRVFRDHGLTPHCASVLFGVGENIIREKIEALNIEVLDLTEDVREIIHSHIETSSSASEDILITAEGLFELMSTFGTLKSGVAYHLIFDDLEIYLRAKERIHELKKAQWNIEDRIHTCEAVCAKATACLEYVAKIEPIATK